MFNLDLESYNPNTPSFYVIFITAIFAFFLAGIIAVTYEYTTKSIYKKAHYLQALVLIPIVAATVMQAIGDSLARGLGMLGALSIIRFRTVLDDPRNITFMFASLAAGIAAGVLGYGIALTGTLVFCLAAIILRFSPLSNTNELIGEVKLQLSKEEGIQKAVEKRLKKHCRNFELQQIRFLNPLKQRRMSEHGKVVVQEISRDNLQEFIYLIRLKDSSSILDLTESLKAFDGLSNIRLNFNKKESKL